MCICFLTIVVDLEDKCTLSSVRDLINAHTHTDTQWPEACVVQFNTMEQTPSWLPEIPSGRKALVRSFAGELEWTQKLIIVSTSLSACSPPGPISLIQAVVSGAEHYSVITTQVNKRGLTPPHLTQLERRMRTFQRNIV